MADGKKGNGWKTVGIIAGSLAAIWLVGGLITGKWNPLKWFTPAIPDEDKPVSDCKTTDGRDGKKDAQGNCVAISAERKMCTGDCQGISAGGVVGYAQACCKSNSRVKGTIYDSNGNNLDIEARARKCSPPCSLKPYEPIAGTYTCDCPSF